MCHSLSPAVCAHGTSLLAFKGVWWDKGAQGWKPGAGQLLAGEPHGIGILSLCPLTAMLMAGHACNFLQVLSFSTLLEGMAVLRSNLAKCFKSPQQSWYDL